MEFSPRLRSSAAADEFHIPLQMPNDYIRTYHSGLPIPTPAVIRDARRLFDDLEKNREIHPENYRYMTNASMARGYGIEKNLPGSGLFP